MSYSLNSFKDGGMEKWELLFRLCGLGARILLPNDLNPIPYDIGLQSSAGSELTKVTSRFFTAFFLKG